MDILKDAIQLLSSKKEDPKPKGLPAKYAPVNLKKYVKQEDKNLVAKQDATAVRSQTKPVSNSSASVAKALMTQRANNKVQQEVKVEKKKEKEKYYNPEVLDIKSGDPKLDLLYKNQWLMDVPILGDYIKSKAKEVVNFSGGNAVLTEDDIKRNKEYAYALGESFRYTGANDNKFSLVDQYFSDKPLLPISKYKPISNYLEFLPSYSIKSKAEDKLKTNSDFINKQLDQLTIQSDIPVDFYEKFLKDKKPVYRQFDQGNTLSGTLNVDLGGSKVGLAWDKEKNLPYLSLSDAWDFEPTSYSKKYNIGNDSGDYFDKSTYIKSSLLHKAGNPFKIYDRFYFDPKTKKYIPDVEVSRRRSTKVNTDKPLPVNRDVIAKRLGLATKK